MQNVGSAIAAQLPLSAVAKTRHGLYFLSGQIAERSLLTSGVAEQTASVCRAIAALLAPEGKVLADIVRVGVFLVDMSDFDEFNAAYRGFFAAPFPARTTVAVRALPFGAKVEIEAVAQ